MKWPYKNPFRRPLGPQAQHLQLALAQQIGDGGVGGWRLLLGHLAKEATRPPGSTCVWPAAVPFTAWIRDSRGVLFLWNLNIWPLVGAENEMSKSSILKGDWSPRLAYTALRDAPK